MTVYLIEVKKPGEGKPPYWYAKKVGERFECIKEENSPLAGINGFFNPIFSLKPNKKEIKAGKPWNSSGFRIVDILVVDKWEDKSIPDNFMYVWK